MALSEQQVSDLREKYGLDAATSQDLQDTADRLGLSAPEAEQLAVTSQSFGQLPSEFVQANPGLFGALPIGIAPDADPVRRARRPLQDPTGEQFGFLDVPVERRFTEGDEQRFFNLPVEAQIILKRRMKGAGLYKAFGASHFDGPGTETDLAVYTALLGFGNRVGSTDPLKALQTWERHMQDAGVDLSQFSADVEGPQLPAPENLRLSVRAALQDQLGKAPPDIVESMITGYTNMYRQRAGGNVAPASPDAFVEGQLESGPNALEAKAFEVAEKMQQLTQYISRPVVPTPTLTRGPF